MEIPVSPIPSGTIVFEQPPAPLDDRAPEWFARAKAAAWSEFQSLPMPTRKDESWRFANLKQHDFSSFVSADALDEDDTDALVERSSELKEVSARVIFANDRIVRAEAVDPVVVCLPISDALAEYGSVIEQYFMKGQGELGGSKFAALHAARTCSGVFVYIPKGVEIAKPVEVFHWISGANASVFPHTLIVTEDNASVSVIEHFQSANDSEACLAIGAVELVAGPGSRIKYVASQRWGSQVKAVHLANTDVDRDASATACLAQLGAAWCRSESVSHLRGLGANSGMISVSVTDEKQEIDQRTLQHHEEAGTTSDLLYKNALHGQSCSIFAGLIQVDENAHQTDAYQTCRNLLLSDEVEANSMPGLEINADGVKCSHGSTSSQISEDEIFYFLARGIDPDTARRLIAIGFTHEPLERLKDKALEDLLAGHIEARFGAIQV